MVLIVWAFSWVSGIFGFVEEASVFKALNCDRRCDYWPRCVRRMENIRDSVYNGWMSQTSKRGKGSGKNRNSSGAASGKSGSGDSKSWGKEASALGQRI